MVETKKVAKAENATAYIPNTSVEIQPCSNLLGLMANVLVACDSVVFGNDGGVNYSCYGADGSSVFGGRCVGG